MPAACIGLSFSVLIAVCLLSTAAAGQRAESDEAPAVVQPGAPGRPTRVLPASTKGTLPPPSAKDVEFMKGMIMHHSQAVEMTDLIADRTVNKQIRLLGARIRHSQADEMKFMERWLSFRGENSVTMAGSSGGHHHHALMPGMLTPKQMEALKKAKGAEFDRLFLTGMIQHHEGALVMVDDLFNTAGAGQDAELFNFATDVDSGQRAEIKSMQNLLGNNP